MGRFETPGCREADYWERQIIRVLRRGDREAANRYYRYARKLYGVTVDLERIRREASLCQ